MSLKSAATGVSYLALERQESVYGGLTWRGGNGHGGEKGEKIMRLPTQTRLSISFAVMMKYLDFYIHF